MMNSYTLADGNAGDISTGESADTLGSFTLVGAVDLTASAGLLTATFVAGVWVDNAAKNGGSDGAYTVQYSTDGHNWSTTHAGAVPSGSSFRNIEMRTISVNFSTNPTARYIRFLLTGNSPAGSTGVVKGKITDLRYTTGTLPPPPPPPPPTPTVMMEVPINVTAHALRNASNQIYVELSWRGVMMAMKYNIYQYGVKIASVDAPTTTYTVQPDKYVDGGTFYTITSVDEDGQESMESQVALPTIAWSKTSSPGYSVPAAPQATNLAGYGHWQAEEDGMEGAPTIVLTWYAQGAAAHWFEIYRNGTLICNYYTAREYLDADVVAGVTYTYTVRTVAAWWQSGVGTVPNYATISSGVNIQAPTAAPAGGGVVTVTAVTPGYASGKVSYNSVAGARAYRIRRVGATGRKYSLGTAVEINGLPRTTTSQCYIEALDSPGPFMRMDGDGAALGSVNIGQGVRETNGTGDPALRPNVIATSAVFNITPVGFTFTGEQAFSDTTDTWVTPVQVPIPASVAAAYTNPATMNHPRVRWFENDKWRIGLWKADTIFTQTFVMNNHLMDTLYDGGTMGVEQPNHNNLSIWGATPLQPFDIGASGKVLHIQFDCDLSFKTGRRWIGVLFQAEGDNLKIPTNVFFPQGDPSNGGKLTESGKGARIELLDGTGSFVAWYPGDGTDHATSFYFNSPGHTELDFRRQCDVYMSKNRIQFWVEGHGKLADVTATAGHGLAEWPNWRIRPWVVHYGYHTSLERADTGEFHPELFYYYDWRPFCDERHWGRWGYRVVDAFP